jgi:hypothetical protein
MGTMDNDDSRALTLMTVGGGLILIALLLPLFTVRYSPPGGSAILYGHRVPAFVDNITGWDFAYTARWTHVLYAAGLILLPIVAWVLHGKTKDQALRAVTDYAYSVFCIVVAFGWVLVLGFAILVGTVSMPTDGEKGILPSFQANPLSPGYQSSPTNPTTPHMSASLGFGWILLLVGIGLGIYGMWRKVALTTIILIALLIIFRFAWHPAYTFLVDWLF